MTVRAFWFNWLNNYGDKLTPWIVEKVTGKQPEFVQAAAAHTKLVAVGSILNSVRRGCVVWGTGMMSKADIADSRAEYCAVRGPLTAQHVWSQGGRAPEIYGDPGILLPRWLAKSTPAYRLGIIPHYLHYAEAKERWKESDVLVVDLREEVEPVTQQITSCERVLSSSLHGLITAYAYGIPHARLEFSKPIGGDGSKFADFYLGMRAPMPPIIDCASRTPSVRELESSTVEMPACDPSSLWEACPIQRLDQA